MILSVVMLGAAGAALALSVLLALRGARERRAAESFSERAVVATADVLETRPKDVAMAGEPVTVYFHLVRYDVDGAPVVLATGRVRAMVELVDVQLDQGTEDDVGHLRRWLRRRLT